MDGTLKQLIVVGGPHGAGKTTFAEKYVEVNDALYLAADRIALELSPADPVAVELRPQQRSRSGWTTL